MSMSLCLEVTPQMAKVYADLIRKGYKTLDDVPAALRAAVEAVLAESTTV